MQRCFVEDVAGVKQVTFLYQLAPGECPKSYGLNVARLARLPSSVIDRAREKSEEFEAAVLRAEIAALAKGQPGSPGRARAPGGSPVGASPSAATVASESESLRVPALSDDEKAVALYRLARRLFGDRGAEVDDEGVALPAGQLERAAVSLLSAARAVAQA